MFDDEVLHRDRSRKYLRRESFAQECYVAELREAKWRKKEKGAEKFICIKTADT